MTAPRTTIDPNAFASPHRTEAERAFIKREPSYWSAKGAEEGATKEANPYVHPAALPRETAVVVPPTKEIGRARHVGPRPKPLELDEEALKPLPTTSPSDTTGELPVVAGPDRPTTAGGSSPDAWARAYGYDAETDARIRGLAPGKRRAYTRRFVADLPVGLVEALARASEERGFAMRELVIRALWEIGIRDEG